MSVFYNLSQNLSFLDGGKKPSFKFSEWKLYAHGRKIKLVFVFCPPYSKKHPVSASIFFQEFSAFLETSVLCPEVLLVSGDFNFHLDDPSDADARIVMELMDTFGLLPPLSMFLDIYSILSSHARRMTLITFPLKSTYYISNHCLAKCQLSIPGPNILVEEVSHRKFKQIGMDNFRSDITSSVLCNLLWTSLDELA